MQGRMALARNSRKAQSRAPRMREASRAWMGMRMQRGKKELQGNWMQKEKRLQEKRKKGKGAPARKMEPAGMPSLRMGKTGPGSRMKAKMGLLSRSWIQIPWYMPKKKL